MSVPAAVLPEPIAVLVLAWGEATPAVRALVEATQAPTPTVDSILVLVPRAAAPTHLSTEKYLLPEPSETQLPPPAAAKPEPLVPAPLPPATEAPASPATEAAATAVEPLIPETFPASFSAHGRPATTLPGWSAVRILRLGGLSLPQLAQRARRPLPAPTWTGPAASPAAPYLGASAPAAPAPLVLSAPEVSPAHEPAQLAQLPGRAHAQLLLPVASSAVAPGSAAGQPMAAPPDEAAGDLALTPDLLPHKADEETDFAPVNFDLLAADSFYSAARAGWPEALAALRQPAAGEPKPANAASAGHPALRPAPPHYPAPDLNFQVIQYARFAVPVALAEPPFAAIYAPAWPTWLAAQELRQRTGRPLVLHVATLAAAPTESADTATGWIAELQRQTLRRADLVLTETPTLAQRLRHELGLGLEVVQAVPAADAEAIARALHRARVRPAPGA